MPSRRSFIQGAAALGISPSLSWADAGSPSFLSAARMTDGSFRLFGLDAATKPVFWIPLPGRGHAAACHPVRPEAIAFARRPGTFAIVLDCAAKREVLRLHAPPDRHFYGHGVFSQDGSRLYTTENAYELGEGRIGVWAADEGYRRIGEFHSGGIGPHDIRRLPGTDTLVVANGGIDTHPDTGREKLNLPTMRPNLWYLSAVGEVQEIAELPPDLRLNSIRHLDVRADGLVAFACQWQGDLATVPPVLGVHSAGSAPSLAERSAGAQSDMRGYIGSVTFSHDGKWIAVTAPRSDRAYVFSVSDGARSVEVQASDVCGVAATSDGFVATTGQGRIGSLFALDDAPAIAGAWDNHMVQVATIERKA